MDNALIIAIMQMVLKYGPKAVIAIGEAMKSDNVTAEDIQALFIDKKPEEYFE